MLETGDQWSDCIHGDVREFFGVSPIGDSDFRPRFTSLSRAYESRHLQKLTVENLTIAVKTTWPVPISPANRGSSHHLAENDVGSKGPRKNRARERLAATFAPAINVIVPP